MKDVVLFGDAYEQLKTVPDETAQMCVTSPPYWGLRDYGHDGQLGLEETPEEYVEKLVAVFSGVKRVLKDDGTLWLNLGDSYAGSGKGDSNGINGKQHCMQEKTGFRVPQNTKPKDLVGIPLMVAFALRSDGWYLRSDIIWHKPNPMPESVKDRPTKSHEYIFLLSKNQKYYYDWEAIADEIDHPNVNRKSSNKSNEHEKAYFGNAPTNLNRCGLSETGRKNKRSVWSINTKPFPEAHFAVYPTEMIAPCIKAGSKPYDIVLDPFFGSGTTGEVCKKLNRHYLGIELNEKYKLIQDKRLSQNVLEFQ